jgi:glyoxylase-like metal-dependent hydrolase (beta-lactamase superfamily II)
MERRIQHLDKPHEISPHLYVVSAEFPHQWNANVYLLKGEQPTLVDCGSTEGIPNLQSNLRQLGLEFSDIKNVLATHGHRDHMYAIHEIRKTNPDVNFYIHKGDRKAIETGDKGRTATIIYEHGDTTLDFEPVRVNKRHVLRDEQTIQAGEHDLFVHHTPGHTPGSVCFRAKIDDEVYLFAGDTYLGHASKESKSNFDDWRNSLEKLKKLDYQHILNGHNPVGDLPIPKQDLLDAIPTFSKMWDPWFRLHH